MTGTVPSTKPCASLCRLTIDPSNAHHHRQNTCCPTFHMSTVNGSDATTRMPSAGSSTSYTRPIRPSGSAAIGGPQFDGHAEDLDE
ncbi:hypothetical protein VTO42DRAFT_2699 [Malbranchea cinnamomea]